MKGSSHTDRWDEVREAFFNPQLSRCDGPVSRLRQIDAMAGFEGVITKLLLPQLWSMTHGCMTYEVLEEF